MARKKLKDIKFPDLPDNYYVPEIDDTLSVEGATADAKAVGDALDLKPDKTELEEAIDDLDERKAEIDGYYETFTSGQTEQIIATEAVTDTEPYIYRKTGGPNDVGDRVYDTLVGGSVVWNQLVDSGATEVTVPNGHKYYANINGTKSIGASTGTAISINDSTEDNVIDLTAAVTPLIADYIYTLETANAGGGVAWFKKYFPKEYHEFCEPHFEHVQTSAKETVGFNQWDEIWEVGGMNSYTGENTSETDRIRSKNYIPILGNQQYCIHASVGGGLVCFYDSEKAFITSTVVTWSASTGYVFTPPTNSEFIRFNSYANYGKVYNHDICINLSDPARNGEYEAYRKRTYPLDSSLTLRGIPKLDASNRLYFDGDIYEHDGTVTRRYGIVDLGTLNYSKTGSGLFTSGSVTERIKPAGSPNSPAEGIFCGLYPTVISSGSHAGPQGTTPSPDMTMSLNAYGTLYFNNASYTDSAAFKTAMSGVYLLYALKTPTTETAEPFQSPMVVDPLGTEEFVDYGVEQGDRDVAVPVGHTSEYPADLRGKLQRLPSPTGTNGDYVITEIDGKLYLKPYVPAVGLTAPTTEGEGE